MTFAGARPDHPSHRDAETRVIGGSEARALVGDAAFAAAWNALARSCPWATPFQSAAFCTAWYASYAASAAPLFVVRGDPRGNLRALFALARWPNGRLTVAGAEQAEYQGWLCAAGEDDFAATAFTVLQRHTTASRVLLKFLPPGIPLARLDADPSWRGMMLGRTVSRSLMRVDAADIARTLKKSGNRSKLNRLRQLGPVRLEQFLSRASIEPVIDEIAAYCDVRQCAMNGSMPFRDDPDKREFTLRLLGHPGLLHATALMVGDRLAAAHLGASSGRSVALGVIAHSPFLAAHSPGKFLILMLGEQLAVDGYEYIDLTPEGAYKDRFATEADQVEVREVYLRRPAWARAALLAAGRKSAKRMARATARALRVPEDRIDDRIREFSRRWSVRGLADVMRGTAGSGRPAEPALRYYRIAVATAAALDPDRSLARDRVSDIQSYDAAPGTPSRQDFCSAYLARLESGDHAYSLVEDGRLVHLSWLATPRDPGAPFCVIGGEYRHPSARARDLHLPSIIRRATDAVALGATGWIYLAVPAAQAGQDAYARIGFQPTEPIVPPAPPAPDASP